MPNCIDCGNHRIIPDPDPTDSFCDDDVAVVCLLVANDQRKEHSRYLADSSYYKCITVSCRPYQVRQECETPEWCPKNKR